MDSHIEQIFVVAGFKAIDEWVEENPYTSEEYSSKRTYIQEIIDQVFREYSPYEDFQDCVNLVGQKESVYIAMEGIVAMADNLFEVRPSHRRYDPVWMFNIGWTLTGTEIIYFDSIASHLGWGDVIDESDTESELEELTLGELVERMNARDMHQVVAEVIASHRPETDDANKHMENGEWVETIDIDDKLYILKNNERVYAIGGEIQVAKLVDGEIIWCDDPVVCG
jgi:hypothetical protein